MCGDKHLAYEEHRASTGKPKIALKPGSHKSEDDMAKQIVGDKPILDAMQKDFDKKSK